jgi:hypothetical protein
VSTENNDKTVNIGSLTFERAGDQNAEAMHYKVFLWGPSGSGKSWASASAPGVFVLLTERNGLQSVKNSNPDARVTLCTDIAAVRQFMRAAAGDELKAHGCRTIVIDSLTEIQRLMKDEILQQRLADERKEAKSKGEKEPTETTLTLADWGSLTEKMRRFMRLLRDVPYHVVCTALENGETDESSGTAVRYLYPSFEGKKLHNEVAQYFNAVGYCFKKEKASENGEKQVFHRVMFEGPSRYLVKPCFPLTGVQEPNVTEWFRVLASGKPSDKPAGEPPAEKPAAAKADKKKKDEKKPADDTTNNKAGEQPAAK